MTIKIRAYQKNGIKTKECIDTFEFCCWQSLADWLTGNFKLHQCPKCKKENLTKHNDFKKDWRIKAIQKANSNKRVNKRTLEGLKEYRQSFLKS